MDEIVKMYGNFILEGIAVICLTFFLFEHSGQTEDRGMLEMLGDNLFVEEKKDDLYTDFREIYIGESNKSAPKIENVMGAQETGIIDLSQVIRANDYEGKELKIEILSVKSMDGEELLEHYNPHTSEITLERAGIYTIEVKATDDGNRTTWCLISIPVNIRIMGANE